MTLKEAGCKMDCFHCPYPDCVVENTSKGFRLKEKNKTSQSRLEKMRLYRETHKEQLREARRRKKEQLATT